MAILFKNANVLNKQFEVDEGLDVFVDGNRIAKIGKDLKDDELFKTAKDGKENKVINCNGNYLIPGFKNAHSHNAMVFIRSLSDDLPLDKWLTTYCFPNEAKLTYEDIYYFTILGIMESLSSGITGSMDMYLDNYAVADASLKTGFRTTFCDTLQKFNKKIAPEEYYLNLNNYKNDNGNFIRYTLGMHAEYTNTKETLKLVSDLTHKYKGTFFTHNSETKKEYDECKERWGGLTPTQVFEEYGLFDYGGGSYHCVWIDDKDIEIFKKHKLIIVTCPGSNVKLASGIAPIKKFLNHGIRVAIGTDGPASNNAIDIFREMYLTTTLQKVTNSDPAILNAKEILSMVFKNGASCLFHEDADCIEEGKLADLVLIDVHKPNMQPLNTFINNLVYSAGKSNVKMTMINGDIRYMDGQFFINEDENYIYKKCNELLKNLLNR